MTSVIISFYERLDHLLYCLASLALDPGGIDEVVVTDDGSSTATVERLLARLGDFPFPVRHVWQAKEGFRVAAARNNGIRHARGDYLLFFDCDFLVLPGTVAVHRALAKRGQFVAGNCKYLSDEQTKGLFSGTLTSTALEALYRLLPGDNLAREQRKFRLRTLFFRLGLLPASKQSLGGHFSIHRRDIESINGYDEQFIGWGGEDEDLGVRLVRAGIYCRPAITEARILHAWHPREPGGQDWRQGANMDYFRRRDRPARCRQGLVGSPDPHL